MAETREEKLSSVERIVSGLATVDYIATRRIATALFVAAHLKKPVLVEGPAGVGKTELALSAARWLDLPLIRMQCYEGLDEGKALYEWKYGKQLLYTQILKEKLGDVIQGTSTLKEAMTRLHAEGDLFYSEPFLEPRPLLKALRQEHGAVLLIDEIDKSDEEFEAFLLEILSDYQVSIPEIGTIKATTPPMVFLTSNNTREMGDALKRRCLHLYIPFPDARTEERIVAARLPGIGRRLNRQLVHFIQRLRSEDLKKLPSLAETLDWARVLILMNAGELEVELTRDTLNVLLKFEVDIETVGPKLSEMVHKARREAGAIDAARA
jgi:MoxR-like ATPase